MASLDPSQILISCPGCGAHYDFPARMAGKRERCGQCGQEFKIPAAEIQEPEEVDTPQYIGVECRLCGTLMYGLPHQVGKKVKCPDCGALTVLPPPPPPKPKVIPAAMEGEQYELWEPEVKPSAAAALQPSFIALSCKKCDTLMYAKADQVGKTIKCPDCGARQVVPPQVAPKQSLSPLASDAETPVLDPKSAPVSRPSAISPEVRRKIYEDERDSAYGQALEKARRTGKKMEVDTRGRPILPDWPLVTGIWRMIFTEEVIARWVITSLVLGFAGQFLGEALLTPLQGMAEAIKLIFTVIGGALLMLWLAMIGPFVVVLVGETADGENKVQQPPQLMAFDWFYEFFCFFMAAFAAGLCGFGVAQLVRLAQLPPAVSVIIVAATVVVVLPFALLSTMLEGSPLGVISPRLIASLGRCSLSWILFYTQTLALAALAGAAAWLISGGIQAGRGGATTLVWALAPIGIAALFIDMRLLGRLAWVIAERMPAKEKSDA